MATRVNELPDFSAPPVVETILAVHFRPLEKFTSAHQGALWDRFFRGRFPILEERPPVQEVQERFGEERLLPKAGQWRISDRPTAPRLWAASTDGEHVLQIQRMALMANWMKTGEAAPYKRHKERREVYANDLESLLQFVQEEQLGELVPTSCVVTYINHVEFDGFDNLASTIAETLTVCKNGSSDGWLPLADNVVLQYGYPLPDESGRLNVQVSPVVRREDKQQLIQLEFTARVKPANQDLASVMAGIDIGHEWVVRGFASITTAEMHKKWGRIS